MSQGVFICLRVDTSRAGLQRMARANCASAAGQLFGVGDTAPLGMVNPLLDEASPTV